MNTEQDFCYVQQNFASVGLFCFARWWNNTFKVWWDVWYGFCANFMGNTPV